MFEFDLPGFVGTLGSYKYQSEPLAELLREFLGDPTLNELKTDIMLTAMRVRDGRPFYFVNNNALTLALPDRINTGALRLVDCITASSAAPTFFEPWMVPGVGVCVDGGVGIAGNPSYQACVEAFEYTPAGTYRPSETTVVSLGTGYFKHEFDPGNLLAWVKWIVDQLLEEPIDQQTDLIRRHTCRWACIWCGWMLTWARTSRWTRPRRSHDWWRSAWRPHKNWTGWHC